MKEVGWCSGLEKKRVVTRDNMAEIINSNQNFHFVLVHGLSHGGWCWYKIRCLLETSGYKVTCLDLKSAGTDRTDPNTVLTWEDYNTPLIELLHNLPENEKVILVGHSAGGLSLTDAINKFGDKKIHMAIYVAANMMKKGSFAEAQDVKDAEEKASEYKSIHDCVFGLGHDQPPTSMIIKREFHSKILYHMSPLEDSTLASMLLRPGPAMAIKSARFTEEPGEAEKVRRVYIKTLYDRVIKPELQEAMIRKWPPSQVFVLESDHSPFFSTPFLLSGFLVKATSSIHV